MEDAKIIMNDEVVETATEEIAIPAVSKSKTIVGIIVVAACTAAYPAYKYVAKPLYRKLKEKKQLSKQPNTVVSNDTEDWVEIEE